jgi:hydantoinase/carbamoylase family amidase
VPQSSRVEIDRSATAARIEADVETLAGPRFTSSDTAIRRYAYIDAYENTLAYFADALREVGFTVSYDAVGTLVARNRPAGEPVFGLGSHCDSNRNGGKYDGTLGVVTALEVCRLNHELELDLPLQVISFLEEEGSGFGQMLLGSRIMAQRIDEEDLRDRFRSRDDGRSFWDHAREAGHHPEAWRESENILDDVVGWIELHIEQGRVLQDSGHRLGVVTAIAGYIHGDLTLHGRADHAGATPMNYRLDVAPAVAEIVLEVERLALAAGADTVATVGEVALEPGLINVVPGKARLSLDTRGVSESAFAAVARDAQAFAGSTAAKRGLRAEYQERQRAPVTPMDDAIVRALDGAAAATGVSYMHMPSGAAHDTMFVAEFVPTAMVFVPCRDGVSHSPKEDADPADAAVAAEVILNAVGDLLAETAG